MMIDKLSILMKPFTGLQIRVRNWKLFFKRVPKTHAYIKSKKIISKKLHYENHPNMTETLLTGTYASTQTKSQLLG